MNTVPKIRDNTAEEEAEIQRQIAEEAGLEEVAAAARVLKRGRPGGQTKEQVTVRVDKDVLHALKSPSAKGWQTRLNEALRRGLEM